MKISTRKIKIDSSDKTDFVNITEQVKKAVKDSVIKEGIVTVFTKHTTTAIRINENEPLLEKDVKCFLDTIAPMFKCYNHDNIEARPVPETEPINAHSHLKALLFGSSESIPIINSKMEIGKWQSIFLIDLDGPRKREVMIQVMGE